MKKRLLTIPLFLLLMALGSGCIISSDEDSTLTIANDSIYDLYEIYVTEVSDPNWGPNLIAGDVLYPGEELTVAVDCGTYDTLVVDEDDVECELPALDLCFDDAIWVIDNATLNNCAF